MNQYDIIGFGINTVDILLRFPENLLSGKKYEVDHLAIQGGGPASNGVCVSGKLGFQSGFVTHLGDNALSDLSRKSFSECGVDADLIPSLSISQPAASLVQVDPRTGERTIFYNLNGYHKVSKTEIPERLIRSAKVLLIDGYDTEGALEILKIANAHGIPTVIDIEAENEIFLRQSLLLASDLIFPLSEASRITQKTSADDVLTELRKQTSARLVLTDGALGSWGMEGNERVHCPAFSVAVLDTTGCGDTYHGAYAAGILFGLTFSERLEFSSYIAARVATGLGGRTTLPSIEEVLSESQIPLSKTIQEKIRKHHHEYPTH